MDFGFERLSYTRKLICACISSNVLLGVKTGSAKVSVRLVSKVYSEKVLPAETRVVVVANLYLVPASAYVMVGGVVNYRAEQIKSNKVSKSKPSLLIELSRILPSGISRLT